MVSCLSVVVSWSATAELRVPGRSPGRAVLAVAVRVALDLAEDPLHGGPLLESLEHRGCRPDGQDKADEDPEHGHPPPFPRPECQAGARPTWARPLSDEGPVG